jgi:hypothetical protein
MWGTLAVFTTAITLILVANIRCRQTRFEQR